MLVTMETNRIRDDIQSLVTRYGRDRSALMPVLQFLQRKYSHLSDEVMQLVADALGIHPSEVYGVVSFYSFLGNEKRGKFVIRLCRTISCEMQNKEHIARQLENDLGIRFGETTTDKRFTLEWANCIGLCDQGPALLVNDKVFTRVTPSMVHGIVEECRRTFGAHVLQQVEEHHS
jgi:[NiFe] hydrogenase diaphorase moiety large subunit